MQNRRLQSGELDDLKTSSKDDLDKQSDDFNQRSSGGEDEDTQNYTQVISSLPELFEILNLQLRPDYTFELNRKNYMINPQQFQNFIPQQFPPSTPSGGTKRLGETNAQKQYIMMTVHNKQYISYQSPTQLPNLFMQDTQSQFIKPNMSSQRSSMKKSRKNSSQKNKDPFMSGQMSHFGKSPSGNNGTSPTAFNDQYGYSISDQPGISHQNFSHYNQLPYGSTSFKMRGEGISPFVQKEVHLAYLFASPLVLQTSEDTFFDCLPPISFKEEFEQIKQTIQQEGLAFTYRYLMANDANLRECLLNDNPVGLHFSGHGFENNEKLFKTDKKALQKYKGKGDILIFEKNNGASEFYCEKDLQEILEKMTKNRNLEFVVVASCHSESAGKTFQKVGIKHVICIDQKKLLLDDAAIDFSRTFYGHIYSCNGKQSICQAFDSARNHVKKKHGALEGDKFKLLLGEGHDEGGHKCVGNKIRRRMVQGQIQYKGLTPKILKLPSKVTPFISRNGDMFDVIRLLQEDNIVQVFGMPGLGKSSILKNVANYIGERNLFIDGVLYINFQSVKSFQEALATIMQNLDDNMDPDLLINASSPNQLFNQSFRKVDKSKLQKQIFSIFKRFRVNFLFVMDNIDDIGKEHSSELATFVMTLVQESANGVKVLFSSSIFYEKLENYKVKKLRGLSKKDSVELFITKIPYQHTELENFLDWEQIMDLHNYTIQKLGEDKVNITLCKHKFHNFKCVKDYLVQHPLFDLLYGQPLSICMIAPLSIKSSLKEIYQQLSDLSLMEVLKGRIQEDSLLLSLEFSLKLLNEKEEKSVELFYLIGITQEGLFEEDLDQLFEEENTNKKLEGLVELSLIQQETFGKESKMIRYKVSTFLDKYVDYKLAKESKRDLNMFLATYYSNKLLQLKKDFSYNEDQQALKLGLLKYEKNVRYCLQQLYQIDFQGKNDQHVPDKVAVDKDFLNVGNATLSPQMAQQMAQQYDIDSSNNSNANSNSNQSQAQIDQKNNSKELEEEKQSDLLLKSEMKERKSSEEEKLNAKPQIPLGATFKRNNMLLTVKRRQISKVRQVSKPKEQNFINDLQVTKQNSNNKNYSSAHDSDREELPRMKLNFKQLSKEVSTSKNSASNLQTPQAMTMRKNSNSSMNKNDNDSVFSSEPKQYVKGIFSSNPKTVTVKKRSNYDEEILAHNISSLLDPNDQDIKQIQVIRPKQDDKNSKVKTSEKNQYYKQLKRLKELKTQNINKGRFDQLVKSLTNRMGGSQQENDLQRIFIKGQLNFSTPLEQQLAQLNIYEQLTFHYISILALIDDRSSEIEQILCPVMHLRSIDDKEIKRQASELRIPQKNKLLMANLKMVYIYHLLKQEKYDALNGENLEMQILYQEINCEFGEAISIYLKAKYLYKMKRRSAFAKAEQLVAKSADKFYQTLEQEGMQQCIKLLKKINDQSPMIAELNSKMQEMIKTNKEEVNQKMEERLELDKIREGEKRGEDKIINMLLNMIEFSYLNKTKDKSKLQPINSTPQIVSKKAQQQQLLNAQKVPFDAFRGQNY